VGVGHTLYDGSSQVQLTTAFIARVCSDVSRTLRGLLMRGAEIQRLTPPVVSLVRELLGCCQNLRTSKEDSALPSHARTGNDPTFRDEMAVVLSPGSQWDGDGHAIGARTAYCASSRHSSARAIGGT